MSEVARTSEKKESVILIWAHFGPYHVDRCEALAQYSNSRYRVIGLEIASASDTYAWEKSADNIFYEKCTLFPNYALREHYVSGALFPDS